MYKIDKDFKYTDTFESNIIPVGINSDVTLDGIVLSEDNRFIEFQFCDANGKTFNRREWSVDADALGADKKVMAMLNRVKHIATQFITIEEFNIEESTFEAFAGKLISLLEPKITAIKLRIKLVYNKRGYVDFPFNTPYIERMDSTTSTLDITSKDVMEKPAVTNVQKESNPITSDVAKKRDDLPF